jgi:hypothetical protein
MTGWVSLSVWVAGGSQFLLLAVSVQIPGRFQWGSQLRLLNELNRKLFVVATGYIVFTYLAFGALTLWLHDEMLDGDRAATGLALFIGLYWLVRLVIDWFWFGHRIWPAGRRYVIAHIGLELLFTYLAAVYLGLVVWHASA